MSQFLSVVILLCIGSVTVCHACPCSPTDPKDDFCKADVVLRARVWSVARDAALTESGELNFLFPDQVYSLKVVEIFKGREKMYKLPGFVSMGVRSPSLMVDLYTPRFISCRFELQKGKEYLLSGYVRDKLRTSFCDLRRKWSHVTPQLRAGLNGQYNCTL